MHDRPRSFVLPRAFRSRGRRYSLQEALRLGVDPRELEVEDGMGDWKPYIVTTPAAPRDRDGAKDREVAHCRDTAPDSE